MLFTHCQKRDFGAKKCSVLSKILIGFSENPLELGKIGEDSWTQIFTAFSMQRGAESLENTAFSGFSHLPLSSVKFRQVRFSPLDSKSGSRASGSWVRIPPCPPIMRVCLLLRTRIYFVFFAQFCLKPLHYSLPYSIFFISFVAETLSA